MRLPLAILATQNPRGVAVVCRLYPSLDFLFVQQKGSPGLPLPDSGWRSRVLLTALSFEDTNTSFFARLEERSPVEFRVVMYQTGLEMFLEKPLTGWGLGDLQPELAKRVHDFHQSAFFFHNTYLEIAVQHGLLGLSLYLWIVVDLFRLGRRRQPHAASGESTFLDDQFRSFWPRPGGGLSV